MHKINLSCKYAYVIAATEGSLRNDDGDAVDEVGWKMNLYFTYKSRDSLKLFSMFSTVKTISKLNREHGVKLEINI